MLLCSNFTLLEFNPFDDATFNIDYSNTSSLSVLFNDISAKLPNCFLNLLLKSSFVCVSDSQDVSCWGCNANSTHILTRGRRNMCIHMFGMLPGFLESFLECINFFWSATTLTKTALGIIQLWFSRHLGIHSSWEAKQKDAAVVGLFTPVSLFLCMETNLLIIHYRFRMPCHLTHTSQPNRQAFQVPLIHYQTFRN